MTAWGNTAYAPTTDGVSVSTGVMATRGRSNLSTITSEALPQTDDACLSDGYRLWSGQQMQARNAIRTKTWLDC